MGFIVILFLICVGGCWLIFSSIGKALFPDRDNSSKYIDNSVHHHHYHIDNRSVHVNGEEFKGLKK